MSANAGVPGLWVTALGVKVDVPPAADAAERHVLEQEAEAQLSSALVVLDHLTSRAAAARPPAEVTRVQTQLRRAIVGFLRAGTAESLDEAARALSELSKLSGPDSPVRSRHSVDRQIVDALWRALERAGGPKRLAYDPPAAAVVVSEQHRAFLSELVGQRRRN